MFFCFEWVPFLGDMRALLGGGNSKICFMFSPNLGEMIQFDDHIFAYGLVQPPTSCCLMRCLAFFIWNPWYPCMVNVPYPNHNAVFFALWKFKQRRGPEFGCDDDPSGVCDLDQGAGPYVVFQGSGRSYEGRLADFGSVSEPKTVGASRFVSGHTKTYSIFSIRSFTNSFVG